MDSIDRIDSEAKSGRLTSRGTSVSLPDFTEQLDATDEHLASRRPRRAGRTSIRSLNPNHNQVAETTTRLELSRETVHVKVEMTSSTPS